jgi:hypothetical protein
VVPPSLAPRFQPSFDGSSGYTPLMVYLPGLQFPRPEQRVKIVQPHTKPACGSNCANFGRCLQVISSLTDLMLVLMVLSWNTKTMSNLRWEIGIDAAALYSKWTV